MFTLSSKSANARLRRYHPQFEALESREVLSTASLSLHAVADDHGGSAVVFMNKNDHQLYEHDANGTRALTGPHASVPFGPTVKSFSAGLGANGTPVVYAQDGSGRLFEMTGNEWINLNAPGTALSFAAVKADRMFAIMQDHHLYEYDGERFPEWSEASSGFMTALDAVTDTSNRDAIYVKNTDATFGQYYATSSGSHVLAYKQLAPAFRLLGFRLSEIGAFSAGTDLNGNADVVATWQTPVAFTMGLQMYANGQWKVLGSEAGVHQISNTDNQHTWFMAGDNSLKKYDALGNLVNVDNRKSFVSISAARSNDLYAVFNNGSMWERTAGGTWTEIVSSGKVSQ
jgi:hypothetical protein